MRAVWLLIALLLLIFTYIWFNPDYKEQLQELSAGAGITKKTVRVYKWRNADGEWQITDHLPPAGVEYERLEYREDVNVLPVPPQLGGD